MDIQEEKYALVNYLLTVKPGPVIEDIIQQRLRVLEYKERLVDDLYFQKHMPVINRLSGIKFDSVKAAAENLGIGADRLRRDIKSGLHRYKCYPL